MTNSINISLANEQTTLPIDEDRLRRAVVAVLTDAGIAAAEISLAIVTDEVIHDLNVRYLAHDYPTDVLSFPLGSEGDVLAGEIVVSADTAITQAAQQAWQAEDELLLYIAHGALHLVGYGDKSIESAADMQAAEDRILNLFDLVVPREPIPDEASPQQSDVNRTVGETI